MRYETARLADFSVLQGEERRKSFDRSFFALVMLLLLLRVIMVLSASFPRAYYDPGHITGGRAGYYFVRQLIFAAAGVAAMLLCSRFPIGFYRRYAKHFMAFTLVLLALVPFIGIKANGSRRWLGVGSLTVQPSELAKLAVILLFAAMLFLGGAPLGWFAAAFGAGGAALGVLLVFFPYASGRITTWRDPFSSSSDEGYQIVQLLYTIGSGGLGGVGLGASRKKYLYLPEEHNDFIFSVLCEELGFLGAVLVLVLFAMLILRGYRIALRCADPFSFLVTAGITTLLALQVFLNVAVVTNLLPCTGISLSFFSYGGTALIIQLVEMGIFLSASTERVHKGDRIE